MTTSAPDFNKYRVQYFFGGAGTTNDIRYLEMNFSEALELIKQGKCLKRSGWNGKDQFIYLVDGSEFEVNRQPLSSIFKIGTPVKYRPHIDMKYQDGTIGVWLSSMGDLMSEDWELLGEAK